MLLIDQLEDITEWMQDNVCNKIHLMKPTEKTGNVEPEYVNPKAFTMFVPSEDMLDSGDIRIPCLCVQLDEGMDDVTTHKSNLNLKIDYAVWNPGKFKTEGDEVQFKPDAEGWKDVFRFIDKTQRELEKSVYIAGMRLDKNTPIKYGCLKDKDGVVENWPYYYGQLTFTLEAGMAAVPVKSYQNLL